MKIPFWTLPLLGAGGILAAPALGLGAGAATGIGSGVTGAIGAGAVAPAAISGTLPSMAAGGSSLLGGGASAGAGLSGLGQLGAKIGLSEKGTEALMSSLALGVAQGQGQQQSPPPPFSGGGRLGQYQPAMPAQQLSYRPRLSGSLLGR